MSVTGFSAQHDPEVAQYRAIRAAFLAKQKQQKQQKAELMASLAASDPSQHNTFFERVFHRGGKHHGYERKAVSVGGGVVSSKKLEDDSDFETDFGIEGFGDEGTGERRISRLSAGSQELNKGQRDEKKGVRVMFRRLA